MVSDEYEILDDYVNRDQKIRVRHTKCGFVWSVKPYKLYNYIGCPHCNKKKSQGEQKIISFLIKSGIEFETEKSFNWQTNPKRRYDFYIPRYNLICEY